MKRIISLLLCFAILFALAPLSFAYEPTLDEELKEAYKNSFELTSWWDVVAFVSCGVQPSSAGHTLTDYTAAELRANENPSYLATAAISLMARGMSPWTSVEGYNIPLALSSMQKEGGSFGDYINQHVYAVIALEAAGAYYDREAALDYIFSCQLDDGGFAFFGETGDVDVTGMVLLALGFFTERLEVSDCVTRAVEFLKEKRSETFGFISPWSVTGKESPESAAAVLSGLVAVGVDVTKDGWDKTLDSLLSCKTIGGFASEPGGTEPNAFSTQQAFVALGDIAVGKSVFKRLPYTGPTADEIFSDGAHISPAFMDSVVKAYKSGLFIGTPQRTFMPSAELLRAEFAAVLSRIDKASSEETTDFSDVPRTAWYYRAAQNAVSSGFMICAPDCSFNPSSGVSYEELCFSVARLLSGQSGDPNGFAEGKAREYLIINRHISADEDAAWGTLDRNITREEAAALLVRMLSK